MDLYKINEIFYSIQGEGARAGSANVFIRFAGCDQSCVFCDTGANTGISLTLAQVCHQVVPLLTREPRNVILTGGEPALQYDKSFHDMLRTAGVSLIAIETNGGTRLKARVDWITCSPKVPEEQVAANFGMNGVDELKYVYEPGGLLPRPKVAADHYYLSPVFRGRCVSQEALWQCIDLVKANPRWKMSVQQHKGWRVR